MRWPSLSRPVVLALVAATCCLTVVGLTEPRRLFFAFIGSLSIAVGIQGWIHKDTMARLGTFFTQGWGFRLTRRLMRIGAILFILYGIFAIVWSIVGPV